jgi:SpoIID/LytB domain protein
MRFQRPLAVALACFTFVSAGRSASLEQGNRFYFGGQPEQALQAYRAVLESQPSVDAALNAATVAQELGRHKEAIAILEQARKSRLGGPGLLVQLAWARLNEGQIESARKLFEEAARAEKPEPIAVLGYALSLLDSGKPAAAAEKLTALTNEQPKLAAGFFLLGRALEESKRADAAVTAYEDAIRADSHFVEVRVRLAPLLERMKRYDDAWRQYARTSYIYETQASLSGMARLAGRITKKPQEILPPHRIPGHTPVPAVAEAATLPVVRVGIGTDAGGAPTLKKNLSFRTSHPFTIVEVKTSSEIAHGDAREPWSIQYTGNGGADIVDSRGQVQASFHDKVRLRLSDRAVGTTIINTLSISPGEPWGGMSDREYRGEFEIVADKKLKGLVIINVVSVEEYLYGVLAAEMPVAWPLEALKAQAVMARNVAIMRTQDLHLHKKYGYDLCDDQHCQVYAGVGVESEKVRTAVDATRGRLLTYHGEICHTVFSSNCGGLTQEGAQAGWGNVAYWQAQSDARPGVRLPSSPWEWKRWVQQQGDVYCRSSQYVSHGEYRWIRIIPADVIAEKLSHRRRLGRVRQIHIVKRGTTGRVQRVRIVGTKNEIILSKEHEIRKYLGLNSLRSNMFEVDTVVRDGRAQSFIFYGAGWGHGVGFCQSGSSGRAEDGASYEEILSAYFPGSTLR